MQRKHKKFSRPRKLYDKPRILDENKLVERYGLKNKTEIWKSEAKVKYFRNRAKALITADSEEQKAFFDRLNEIGIEVNSIADVLALNKENILKRRLSTVLVDKGIATKPKQARQMIAHKRITIDGRVVNSPSYLVKVEEEKSINLKQAKVREVKTDGE